MKIFLTFLLSAFLVLQISNCLPSPSQEDPLTDLEIENETGKVRDKRKSEDPATVAAVPVPAILASEQKIPALKAAPEKPVEAVATEKKITKDVVKILPEIAENADDSAATRVKKQAIKVPCSSKTVCGLPTNVDHPRQNKPDLVLVDQDQTYGEVKKGRTIEPIYSFGPVSVNSAAGYGHNAALGHNYNLGLPARPIYSPSSAFSSQSYSPAGLSYQVVMPYAIPHHQPISHTLSLSHAAPVEIKPVVYYEAPEPIIVDAHENSIHTSHAEDSYAVHDVNPVSLYCQTMKSKELAKALSPSPAVKGKSNDTDDTLEHIQRVNEIKDEIVELNAAAQRIVDQQEKLYRMQQDQMVMAPGRSEEMMRSASPFQMKSYARMPPYMPPYGSYPGSYMRPYYREEEILEPVTEAAKKDEVKAKAKEEVPKVQAKKEETEKRGDEKEKSEKMMVPEYHRSEEEDQMRHMRPYYYRTEPEYMRPMYGNYYRTFPAMYGSEYVPYQRSETGFPTAPLFQMRSQPADNNYRASPEDVHFFKQLLDAGKKMGVLPQDKPAEKTEENDGTATRSENVLDDLIRLGEKQKAKASEKDEPSKIEMNLEPEVVVAKKNKRGLIHKN